MLLAALTFSGGCAELVYQPNLQTCPVMTSTEAQNRVLDVLRAPRGATGWVYQDIRMSPTGVSYFMPYQNRKIPYSWNFAEGGRLAVSHDTIDACYVVVGLPGNIVFNFRDRAEAERFTDAVAALRYYSKNPSANPVVSPAQLPTAPAYTPTAPPTWTPPAPAKTPVIPSTPTPAQPAEVDKPKI
jgi:hypothetical protein